MELYNFSFKATRSITAGDPVTGERGARVDFQKIPAGKSLYIPNLEIVPVAALRSALSLGRLSNPGRSTEEISCPDEVVCLKHVRITLDSRISNPFPGPLLYLHLASKSSSPETPRLSIAIQMALLISRTSVPGHPQGKLQMPLAVRWDSPQDDRKMRGGARFMAPLDHELRRGEKKGEIRRLTAAKKQLTGCQENEKSICHQITFP